MKVQDLIDFVNKVSDEYGLKGGDIEIKVCTIDKNGNPHTGYANKNELGFKVADGKTSNFTITVLGYEGGK